MACAGVSLEPGNLVLDSRKAPVQDSSWALAVCPCRKRLMSDLTLPCSLTPIPGASAGQRPLSSSGLPSLLIFSELQEAAQAVAF